MSQLRIGTSKVVRTMHVLMVPLTLHDYIFAPLTFMCMGMWETGKESSCYEVSHFSEFHNSNFAMRWSSLYIFSHLLYYLI